MESSQYPELENIFRNAGNFEDLFDGFRKALSSRSGDIALYKTLLANKNLTPDQVSFFTEKLCAEYPEHKYDLCMWSGSVLSAKYYDYSYVEKALSYFLKAINTKKDSAEPYESIAGLYDSDLNMPDINLVTNVLNYGLKESAKKSRICRALAEIYGKTNNISMKKRYLALMEKYSRGESN
jgi:tetratricopeptide (TPR) repeat protein